MTPIGSRVGVKDDRPIRLATDGDALERACWKAFIEREFPSYERFWLPFVVPVTRRDADRTDVRLKSDAELSAMTPPRSFFDIYLAQLNYSVLWHLAVAYELRRRSPTPGSDFEQFTHCVVRLCSALDVADELLQRHRGPVEADPWSSAQKRRRAWRAANPEPGLKLLQEYRHQLIHSGAVVSGRSEMMLIVPRVGRHHPYRDWRSLNSLSRTVLCRDFRPANQVMDEAWSKTLRYLERWWRWMLRERHIRVRLGAIVETASVPLTGSRTEPLLVDSSSFQPLPVTGSFGPADFPRSR